MKRREEKRRTGSEGRVGRVGRGVIKRTLAWGVCGVVVTDMAQR